jgi:hypothetical protein
MVEGRQKYVKKKRAREQKELTITIYSTGVDDGGRLLPDGAVDSHWRLAQGEDGTWKGPKTYTVRSATAPIPPWIEQTATAKSKWITPNTDGVDVAGGTYVYEQTFTIDARMDLNTASVFGRVSGDDVVTSIAINGEKVGGSTNFANWLEITITDHLVVGENTLRVVVRNDGDAANPHGVRVELTGSADAKR